MFGAIEFWHWWTVAVLLAIAEAFAPGFVFGWLAMPAGLTGALLLALPDLGWQLQLLSFAGFAIVSVPAWLFYVRHRATPKTTIPPLNRRGVQCIGRRCTVVEPIENGRGRVRLGDSTWTAAGADMPAGTRVRVVGVDNTVLLVEPDPTYPPEPHAA